jgi:hypothetical protein
MSFAVLSNNKLRVKEIFMPLSNHVKKRIRIMSMSLFVIVIMFVLMKPTLSFATLLTSFVSSEGYDDMYSSPPQYPPGQSGVPIPHEIVISLSSNNVILTLFDFIISAPNTYQDTLVAGPIFDEAVAMLTSGNNCMIVGNYWVLPYINLSGDYISSIDLSSDAIRAGIGCEVDIYGVPVPEPSTFVLIGAGIAGLGLVRRRAKK